MPLSLPHRLAEWSLRRRHRRAQRRIAAIEALDLPEDLRLAAVRRVQRRLEEELSQFTR